MDSKEARRRAFVRVVARGFAMKEEGTNHRRALPIPNGAQV